MVYTYIIIYVYTYTYNHLSSYHMISYHIISYCFYFPYLYIIYYIASYFVSNMVYLPHPGSRIFTTRDKFTSFGDAKNEILSSRKAESSLDCLDTCNQYLFLCGI